MAIFVILFSMVMPIMMVIFGLKFQKSAPTKINTTHGYRSKKSMASIEAWKYAHNLLGQLWTYLGIITGIGTIGVLLKIFDKSENTVMTAFMITAFVQMLLFALPIIPIEIRLKKLFDEEGNRKYPYQN